MRIGHVQGGSQDTRSCADDALACQSLAVESSETPVQRKGTSEASCQTQSGPSRAASPLDPMLAPAVGDWNDRLRLDSCSEACASSDSLIAGIGHVLSDVEPNMPWQVPDVWVDTSRGGKLHTVEWDLGPPSVDEHRCWDWELSSSRPLRPDHESRTCDVSDATWALGLLPSRAASGLISDILGAGDAASAHIASGCGGSHGSPVAEAANHSQRSNTADEEASSFVGGSQHDAANQPCSPLMLTQRHLTTHFEPDAWPNSDIAWQPHAGLAWAVGLQTCSDDGGSLNCSVPHAHPSAESSPSSIGDDSDDELANLEVAHKVELVDLGAGRYTETFTVSIWLTDELTMPSSTVGLACWTRVINTCYCEAAIPYPLCGLGLLHMMPVWEVCMISCNPHIALRLLTSVILLSLCL